jgi:hypothetical protein
MLLRLSPTACLSFFSSDKKESARISDLLKSGPLKTRIALGEANAMIQRLAQTIQAAGFDVRDLVQGQVPDGIMNIKRQISNVAARAGRLASSVWPLRTLQFLASVREEPVLWGCFRDP